MSYRGLDGPVFVNNGNRCCLWTWRDVNVALLALLSGPPAVPPDPTGKKALPLLPHMACAAPSPIPPPNSSSIPAMLGPWSSWSSWLVASGSMRIEAARRLFSKVWFNEATTEAGRDALGYYHERRDERRDVQLGPEHNWSSHAADAFGSMAVSYEEPGVMRAFNRKIEYPRLGIV
jgi:hypothetical protein